MKESITRVPTGSAEYSELVQWLYDEAYLLDSGEFEQWFNLMTEDISYEMPARISVMPKEGSGFAEHSGLFSENHSSLMARVKRLQTEQAWAEQPRSRTRHLITNVVVDRMSSGDFDVRSAFLITRARADRVSDTFTGERHDILRRAGSSWKLARRLILLDQTVIKSHNLSFFF
jgi:3-phenylpropionate/cinnamic acid dioxygenase small subunit